MVRDILIDYEKMTGQPNVASDLSFEEMIADLNKPTYNEFAQGLQFNQHNEYLLIRYGVLSELQEGFWNESDSIYRECRSLVLDLSLGNIVTTSFRKFFNLGEIPETSYQAVEEKINTANSFTVTEKLDGSMQVANWYQGELWVNGSMALKGENSWRLTMGMNMLTVEHIEMLRNNPNLCFIFEMVSPENPHVVRYEEEEEGMYLIGIRNKLTGIEAGYHFIEYMAHMYNVPKADQEHYTLPELIREMKEIKAVNKEGWVLSIDNYKSSLKVKIKGDDYVMIHRVLDRFASDNMVVEAVARGTIDDIIAKIPDTYQDEIRGKAYWVANFIELVKIKSFKYYFDIIVEHKEKRDFMIEVTNVVPRPLQGYVRNIYLDKENHYLWRNQHPKKAKDIERELKALEEGN